MKLKRFAGITVRDHFKNKDHPDETTVEIVSHPFLITPM